MTVIKNTFVNFYSSLLGKPHTTTCAGYDRISQLITKRLTNDQSMGMVQDVSNNKIMDIIKELDPLDIIIHTKPF